ncbi:MAG: LysM peptidoglycan-binding domain-containing protein [Alphaproteobacteria bacterium]|nr:LysM peptidoglycan-binding domain-containing protein [Alphaproteobacteria bacterium]
MRYGTLIGSATAVLLLVAAGAVVFRGGGTPRSDPPKPEEATAPPSEATPALAKPTEAVQPAAAVPPSFDVVKVGPTGTVVIAGRAEPGAKVIVRDGDKAIGQVTADRRGEWVLIPEQPIGSGNRLLSAEASSSQNGSTVKSEETVALSISPTAPAKSAGETALAVVLPRQTGHAARVLQLPEGASPGKPNALSMDTAEYDAEGRVVLSGRAAPGATVQVYLGNEPLATVTADASGAWSATSSHVVPPGQLELRLDQLASSGVVVQRVALPFTPAAAVEPAPGQNYVVQRGNNLWRIAQRAYGAGTRYVVIYSANPDQIRNPDKIYPGQVFKIPKS